MTSPPWMFALQITKCVFSLKSLGLLTPIHPLIMTKYKKNIFWSPFQSYFVESMQCWLLYVKIFCWSTIQSQRNFSAGFLLCFCNVNTNLNLSQTFQTGLVSFPNKVLRDDIRKKYLHIYEDCPYHIFLGICFRRQNPAFLYQTLSKCNI